MSLAISIPGFLKFNFQSSMRIVKVLASGGSGQVSVAYPMTPELKTYGDKIVSKNLNVKNQTEMNSFYQEISLTYFLQPNKNIARFLGFTENPYCILMKYYERGPLDAWISNSRELKSKRIMHGFLMDIASGLNYMHSQGIAHCDLKPANVLIDIDPETNGLFCVLTDFGITKILDEKMIVQAFPIIRRNGLSIGYAAPEMLLKFRNQAIQISFYQTDIYAVGMILFDLMTRKFCIHMF